MHTMSPHFFLFLSVPPLQALQPQSEFGIVPLLFSLANLPP